MDKQINKGLFVLAQSWPDLQYGGSIAVTAALKQYVGFFDKIVFLCLNEKEIEKDQEVLYPSVDFYTLFIKRSDLKSRFLLSLLSRKPAITMGMHSKQLFNQIRSIIDKHINSDKTYKYVGIIDDNVPGIHLKRLKKVFPHIPWAYKTHDLLHKAFQEFAQSGNIISRMAWKLEVNKIKSFELEAIKSADIIWTITNEDKEIIERIYRKKVDGVFDVDIDHVKYQKVAKGKLDTIIYLGSADRRKGHGLRIFLREAWPTILIKNPEMKLLLGGRKTELFSKPESGVHGIGQVSDEIEFLGKGQIFINPQIAGSGLKLKSLVAMAAGKLLVTTKNGSLGVGGLDGKHYLVGETPAQIAEKINDLLKYPDSSESMRKEAKKLIKTQFSQTSLRNRVQPHLMELWNKKLEHQ